MSIHHFPIRRCVAVARTGDWLIADDRELARDPGRATVSDLVIYRHLPHCMVWRPERCFVHCHEGNGRRFCISHSDGNCAFVRVATLAIIDFELEAVSATVAKTGRIASHPDLRLQSCTAVGRCLCYSVLQRVTIGVRGWKLEIHLRTLIY